MKLFGLDVTRAGDVDPHIACKTTIRSLEQQRDTAIAMAEGWSKRAVTLVDEVVRLSERNVPDYGDSALEPLPSTLENDQVAAVVLRDPERLRRPEPGPTRVDD